MHRRRRRQNQTRHRYSHIHEAKACNGILKNGLLYFILMQQASQKGVKLEKLSYFIITRELFESAIWRDNPHVLKLFIYLIGKARYRSKPKKFAGFEIQRGELVTSLQIIADDNQYIENRKLKTWNRMRVSRMLKYLEKHEYIKILCDTYGTHIMICNYSKYQSPETYKRYNGVTQVLQQRYADVTQVLPYNKDNNDNKDKKENNIREKFLIPGGDKLKSNGHDWIDSKSWDKFVDFRNQINKPITPAGVGFLLEVLEQNQADQADIIKNSIRAGYSDLYPLKKKGEDSKWDELRKEFCES